MGTDTRTQILDIAERLLQQRGYNAFSYQDIADELGIRKASLHYHFATKAALGAAIAVRHGARVGAALQHIDGLDISIWQRLDLFFEPFLMLAKSCNLMCVGGVLAAESSTLPVSMQTHMGAFFTRIHAWLTQTLEAGRADGHLTFDVDPAVKANTIIATLEGLILISKAHSSTDFIDPVIADIKASLGA